MNKSQALSLIKAFRAKLLEAKLDRDWNAVELFNWLNEMEKTYAPREHK